MLISKMNQSVIQSKIGRVTDSIKSIWGVWLSHLQWKSKFVRWQMVLGKPQGQPRRSYEFISLSQMRQRNIFSNTKYVGYQFSVMCISGFGIILIKYIFGQFVWLLTVLHFYINNSFRGVTICCSASNMKKHFRRQCGF